MTVSFVEAKPAALRTTREPEPRHDSGSTRGCAIIWMFAPNDFPQSPQNVAIEFFIHCLSWLNKFLVHDAFNIFV